MNDVPYKSILGHRPRSKLFKDRVFSVIIKLRHCFVIR